MDRNNIIDQNIKNVNSFENRINEIIDNSEDYLKDFYNESPNYVCDKEYVQKLIWLTYSHEEKKNILDNELELYFRK
uniref:Uncharacterized protein n=1 Tax=viral metagenome TaxID=1070528 RepID=A0A6C0C7Q1_9ZZZZ